MVGVGVGVGVRVRVRARCRASRARARAKVKRVGPRRLGLGSVGIAILSGVALLQHEADDGGPPEHPHL
eukprot:scaffold44092_cov34-Phaeocystis_antarctica.AAC.4